MLRFGAKKHDEDEPREISPELSEALQGLKDKQDTHFHYGDGVAPWDDFYRFVNGAWLDTFEIPDDKAIYGAFHGLRDKTSADLIALIQTLNEQGPSNADEQKIMALYQSYMDTDKVEALGLSPIEPMLNHIQSIDSIEALVYQMANLHAAGVKLPFAIYVSPDVKAEDEYALHITQSGLGLPEKQYYLKDDEKHQEYRQEYRAYITRLLEKAGLDPTKADMIIELETKMAQAHWERERLRDANARYNKLSMEQLCEGKHFPWQQFFEESGCYDLEHVIVGQVDYLQAFDDLFQSTSLEDWKAYMAFRTVNQFASYLPNDLASEKFNFYRGVLSGIKEPEPRGKRAMDFLDGTVGESLGKVYVAHHFPEEAKIKMIAMIDNIKQVFATSIENNTWMSDTTKAQALEKLAKMTIKLGYPDQWENIDDLEFSDDDLFGNVMAVSFHESLKAIDKIGKPVNKEEWHMNPQTVNAYFNPTTNEICFPAAILQPPFFDKDAIDALNYGAIGAVIGHEISHAFDDQGSHYNAEGKLVDWWTQDDLKEFQKRVEALALEYDAYEPLEGVHVNGHLTLGENIADLTGLTMAVRAYKMSHPQDSEPGVDGFTPTQSIFLSFSNVWRNKAREDAIRSRVATDPHAPGEFRANGTLRNVDAFHEAFETKEGDDMYKPEEKRIKLWS